MISKHSILGFFIGIIIFGSVMLKVKQDDNATQKKIVEEFEKMNRTNLVAGFQMGYFWAAPPHSIKRKVASKDSADFVAFLERVKKLR